MNVPALTLGANPATLIVSGPWTAAQSASLSLASVLFRQGNRDQAERNIHDLLTRTQPLDPWWDYWPGDYRLSADLFRAMREAVK